MLSTDLPVTEHHAVGARRLSSHHGWWPSAALYPRSVPPVWAVIGYGSPTELDVHNGLFCAAHLLRALEGPLRAMSGRLTGTMDGWFTNARRCGCALLCQQSVPDCPLTLTRRVTSARSATSEWRMRSLTDLMAWPRTTR